MTAGTDWTARLARRTTRRDGALGAILALANAEGLLNFSGGFPAPEVFPTGVLAGITQRLLVEDAAVALQYAPSAGLPSTVAAVADHLERIDGLRPAAGELMITSGGIDAVTLLATSMLDPGDVVVVEEPSYVGAVGGFAAFDAVLRGVALDGEGLDVDALARLLADGLRPKLVYTIPDFQNPTGRSLALPRRHALVDLCRRHDILLVEDVAYRELAFDEVARPPSLWSIAPDAVTQIGTFSKTVFPGIRLGWAAGPPAVVAELVVAKQNSDQCAGALGQRMVEEYLRGGHFPEHVTAQRALYRRRGRALQQALHDHLPPDVTWTEPDGGFFVWVRVPGVDTVVLGELARAAGVAFVPGSPFFAERPEHDRLRLSFSRVDEAAIDEGVRRLGAVIESARRNPARDGGRGDATAGRR